MRIDYKHGEEQEPMDLVLDGQDIELRDVFNGIAFVSAEGERLSICMRDNGFEAHYYTLPDEEGKSFDAGWFLFSSGVVNDDKPEPTAQPPRANSEERFQAWMQATGIADTIIQNHPLEAYRVGPAFGYTSTNTPAEQRMSLIRDIANWLIGEVD